MRGRGRFARTVRQQVVVHLKSGTSLAGVLVAEYDDCIALANGYLLGSDGAATALDGEALIRYPDIDWTQVGVSLEVA